MPNLIEQLNLAIADWTADREMTAEDTALADAAMESQAFLDAAGRWTRDILSDPSPVNIYHVLVAFGVCSLRIGMKLERAKQESAALERMVG